MILRIHLIILVIFISGSPIIGQEMTRTDLLGNHYIWSSFELKKTNSEGVFLFSWQNLAGGKITWVDPGDPFRILTFSKESNQVFWLDNKLAPIGDPLNLDELGLHKISGICSSKDGGLWVFDHSTQLLINLNHNLDKQIEVPIRIKLENSSEAWVQMIEWKQHLYLLIPGENALVADLFGQISKRIPIKASSIHIYKSAVLFISVNDSLLYLPETGDLKSLIKKP